MPPHRTYGARRDTPDPRDRAMALPFVFDLPAAVDLRPLMPPVVDQLQLGACTGNAIAGAIHYDLLRQKLPAFAPSRLFIYWNERSAEGTVDQDSGASIRDGIKSVNLQGVCPEDLWPYDIATFTTKPSDAAYAAATLHKAVQYARVSQTENQLKLCLATGYPVVVGFVAYEGLESAEVAKTGTLQLPGKYDVCIGGHAVLVVGYDDASGRWIVRNSWGAAWGAAGYFTMPYAYLLDATLAFDFWAIRLMGG